MKTQILAVLILATAVVRAEIIAQWHFNSVPPDASTTTGSTNASYGSGTVRLVGGVHFNFAAGHKTDPAMADNSALNLSGFPAGTESNKSAGLQVAANTAGYRDIKLSWSHRCSATASKYFRLQCSADGANFFDATNVFVISYSSNQTVFFTNFSADISMVAGAADNPNFAFRIVTEFGSSATTTGAPEYVAAEVGRTYGSGGTARFEMLTVSGTPIGTPNQAPTISVITNVVMRANSSCAGIPFTIGDAETAVGSLILLKSSSNPVLLPESGLVIGGSSSNRSVAITPALNQTGSVDVSIAVVDQGGKSNSVFFSVLVMPTNTPPVVSVIQNAGTVVGTSAGPLPFTIGDVDTPAQQLAVTATSGNIAILPNTGIVIEGAASNRTMTLTPAAGKVGHVPVKLTVSDSVFTTERTFVLSIDPSPGILFQESFSYAAGSLITNSAFLWQTHSGNEGELSVIDGTVYVSSANNEDVNVRLRGEPYTPTNRAVLYYSLTISAYNLPTTLGDYFAHLKDNGSTFRAKLFVSATNAPLGYYRIGVANGASLPNSPGFAEVATEITIDQTNLVVVRYEVATGVSTLWLNPTSEGSPSVTAADVIGSTNNVTQFALRESRYQGDLYLDDIRVATNFDEAMGRIQQNIRLRITRNGGTLVIAWPSSAMGYTLQSCAALETGDWTPVSQAPVAVGAEFVLTVDASFGEAFYRLSK